MKRQRSDSIDKRKAAAQAKAVTPPSSVPLDKDDIGFFSNVIDEFARVEWTAHQLELAAMLARDMADLQREQITLREEGFVAVRENGTTVENPRVRVCNGLKQGILAQRRSLSLHARARGGDKRDIAKRREAFKASETTDDDDLLARPN